MLLSSGTCRCFSSSYFSLPFLPSFFIAIYSLQFWCHCLCFVASLYKVVFSLYTSHCFYSVFTKLFNHQPSFLTLILDTPIDRVHVIPAVRYPLIPRSIPQIWVLFLHSMLPTFNLFQVFRWSEFSRHCWAKPMGQVSSHWRWTSCIYFTSSFNLNIYPITLRIRNGHLAKRHFESTPFLCFVNNNFASSCLHL